MLVLSMAGRGIRGLPLSLEPCQSPLHCRALGVRQPWMLTHDRGCIGSSGNVRKGKLARDLSWNMGKLVFSGEWQLYRKPLQLLMWSSFKVSRLGYPNQFIHSFIHSITVRTCHCIHQRKAFPELLSFSL
jgi:hypothetical protein